MNLSHYLTKKYVFIFFALNISANLQAQEKAQKDVVPSLTAIELVNIIDNYRGLGENGFSFDITNISYRDGRDSRTNQLSVDVKAQKSIVKFQSPARQKGRVLLKQDKDMWLYIPGTRNVIRISPAQRLLGETSNADVTGSNLKTDYNASISGHDVESAQIKLILEAKAGNTSYNKIIYWLSDVAPYKPIKSEYYARSGKLLKTAEYKEFKTFDGELKIHKMLLSDPLISGSYTWMKFDNYRASKLPQAAFSKEAIVNL